MSTISKRELSQNCFVASTHTPGYGMRYYLHINYHRVQHLQPWSCLDGESVQTAKAGYVVVNAIRAAVLKDNKK